MKRSALPLLTLALVAAGFLVADPAAAQPVALEVNPESQNRTNGTTATLTVSVRDGVTPMEDVNVDLEIESGPNDADGGLLAPPDMTCTTGEDGACQVTYTDNAASDPPAPN